MKSAKRSARTTKSTQKERRNRQNGHFWAYSGYQVSKAASIFYRNRLGSAFWILEMRSFKGRIDHPSLCRFPLAGASGTPKTMTIWMISRVWGTDLRVLDIDFEGLGPSNRTILGKSQPPFFTPREKLTPNSTIFVALARLEIRFRDLCGRKKAGYVFWLYFCCF